MKAVILVGGEGSRLRPLTIETPKQMLSVVGKTMLERVLIHLSEHGIDEAVLSLGYRPDVFIDAYPSGFACGVKLSYAVESTPLDTAGAIRFAVAHAGFEETLVVVNGDVLADTDITALIGFHRSVGAEATISLVPVEDPSRFGVVPTDQDGRVTAFIEKPTREEAPTNYINAGIYVLELAAINRIELGAQVSMERSLFPELVKDGALFALPSNAYWIDAGTPASLHQASMDILNGVRMNGSKTAGEVWTDPTTEIQGQIFGNCFFGENSRIGADSNVHSSIIERNVSVGPNTLIRSSVIMRGAIIGRDCVIEESIIGEGASVPDGSFVLAGSVIARMADLEPGCRIVATRVPA